MPSGTSQGIGKGLSVAATNFLNSFYQAKSFEMQQKLQKNQPVIDFLQRRLEKGDLPLKEQNDIIDHIGLLTNPKADRPLSQILGSRKLEEQDFGITEDHTTNIQTGTVGGGNELGTDFSPIPLYGTKNEEKIVLHKRGDLSDDDIKAERQRRLIKANDASDLDRQIRVARVNAQLQEESYRRLGYNREIFRGTDADGNYKVILANQAGEQKEINLGKGMKSEKILTTEEIGQRPSARYKERYQFHISQGSTPEEADRLASKDLDDFFDAQVQGTKERTLSTVQGNTGTKPPTPAQIADDTRDIENRRLNDEKEFNKLEAEASQISNNVQTKVAEVKEARTLEQLSKEELDKIEDHDSVEYRAAKRDLETKIAHRQRLESDYNTLVNQDKAMKARVERERKRISTRGSRSLSSQGLSRQQIETQKIQEVRAKNPNTSMSDAQILQYLKDKKIIPWK